MINQEKGVSRRDFLKLSASGVLSVALRGLKIENFGSIPEHQVVHGIDVYGIDAKINTIEDAKDLTLAFDLDFEGNLPKDIEFNNRWEERDYLMPKDKRYVQFVVTENTYNEFLKKRAETGLDYVEWAQIHLDLMNRMSKSQPGLENFRIEIKRVIVVGDNFKSNPMKHCKDIDALWFNNVDYRFNTKDGSGYQWRVNHQKNGDLVFNSETYKAVGYKDEVVLPKASDLLQERSNNILIDCGLTHELSHMVWNLPDEYVQDGANTDFIYKNFLYRTFSFTRPYMSPYLKALLLRNKDKGIRGFFTDPKAMGTLETPGDFSFYGEAPQKISFYVNQASDFTLFKNNFEKANYYSKKSFYKVSGTKQETDGKFVLPKETFKPNIAQGKDMYSTLFVIEVLVGEIKKELYFPVALFNIPAIFGEEDANYTISFTGYEPGGDYSHRQILEYVDGDEVQSFMSRKDGDAEPVYALMSIPGTNKWAAWSFVR